MGKAKDIWLEPIQAKIANQFIKRTHYSGKVAQNSQLHIGVFYKGILHGAMQFGPSLDKRKIQGLVDGTKWHEFMELNRLAFDDVLPRNSESRAIAIAMKILRQHAPQLKWVISFADATQCGDGTIYRASGFVLTGIKRNTEIYQIPGVGIIHEVSLKTGVKAGEVFKVSNGRASARHYVLSLGGQRIPGFQLRYIYFLDPAYRSRLTVPEIPYSQIWEMGAGMYKGEKVEQQR